MQSGEVKLGTTLFSYSLPFYLKEKRLSELMKAVREAGADGIELVAAQMMEKYPWPDEAWLSGFRSACDQSGVAPIAYGAYVDLDMRSDRKLSDEEIFEATLNDMRNAAAMGMPIVRTLYGIGPKVLERVEPYAREYGVRVGVEMHHPHNPQTPVWREFFELFSRMGSPYIGVIPDFGMFVKAPVKPFVDGALSRGFDPGIMDYLLGEWKAVSDAELIDGARSRGLAGRHEPVLFEMLFRFRGIEPSALREVMKYAIHIHAKSYYVDERLGEAEIPYPELLAIVVESGYRGYIMTEYEGHLFDSTTDCFEQVRRHIAMEKKLLDPAAG